MDGILGQQIDSLEPFMEGDKIRLGDDFESIDQFMNLDTGLDGGMDDKDVGAIDFGDLNMDRNDNDFMNPAGGADDAMNMLQPFGEAMPNNVDKLPHPGLKNDAKMSISGQQPPMVNQNAQGQNFMNSNNKMDFLDQEFGFGDKKIDMENINGLPPNNNMYPTKMPMQYRPGPPQTPSMPSRNMAPPYSTPRNVAPRGSSDSLGSTRQAPLQRAGPGQGSGPVNGPPVGQMPMGPPGPVPRRGPGGPGGPPGSTRPSGPNRPNGLSNIPNGPNGPSRPNGPNGMNGPNGPNGPMGPMGPLPPNALNNSMNPMHAMNGPKDMGNQMPMNSVDGYQLPNGPGMRMGGMQPPPMNGPMIPSPPLTNPNSFPNQHPFASPGMPGMASPLGPNRMPDVRVKVEPMRRALKRVPAKPRARKSEPRPKVMSIVERNRRSNVMKERIRYILAINQELIKLAHNSQPGTAPFNVALTRLKSNIGFIRTVQSKNGLILATTSLPPPLLGPLQDVPHLNEAYTILERLFHSNN